MSASANRQTVLDAIHSFVEENGRTPFIRELKEITGLSAIEYYLKSLAREGAIVRAKYSQQFQVVKTESTFVDKRIGHGPRVKKLDGRRLSNQRQADQRTRTRSHGRGAEFVIHGSNKSKRDPQLQERIDQVVAAALAREKDHNTDVVHGFHHVAGSRLRASKIG
jgi:SOS-response transcriptional repressor LexA